MVTTVAVLASILCRVAAGHAYMTFPAARNSAWRFGFNTPINYNDMGLRAGGPDVVYAGPTKSFGVCGDPAAGPQLHAGGGMYATGKITASFQAGDVVAVSVAVVAHHMGWFEMALCANPPASGPESESCFVRLRRPGGQADALGASNSDSYYWHVPPPSAGTSWTYTANFALPAGVTCARCVLRWHWITNNNPPPGKPEEFWNCADIAIAPRAPSAPPLPPPLPAVPATTFRVEVVGYNQWWLSVAPLPPAQAGRNGVVLLHPTKGRVPLAPIGGTMVLGGSYSTGASAGGMPAAVGGMVEVEVTDADSGVVSRVCVALPACTAPCVSPTACSPSSSPPPVAVLPPPPPPRAPPPPPPVATPPPKAPPPPPPRAPPPPPPLAAPKAPPPPPPAAAPKAPPPPVAPPTAAPPPPVAPPLPPPPPPVAAPRAPPPPVVAGGVAGYNYSDVVRLSMLFFEAQRAGRLPAGTKARVPWRGDSCAGDGADVGADLSGGYFDAGDFVKFGLPGAFSVSLLAWGLAEAGGAAEWPAWADAVRWGVEWWRRAHLGSGRVVAQVGSGVTDHASWGRPEDALPLPRPSSVVSAACPGSEVAAEAAAAFAAASLALPPGETADLLGRARDLFALANTHRGTYAACAGDAASFYASHSGYGDELAWAAAWIARASGLAADAAVADSIAAEFNLDGRGGTPWAFSWDDKAAGVLALGAARGGPKAAQYAAALGRFVDSYRPGGSVPTTPKGLAYRDAWGPLRYAMSAAFLAVLAAAPPTPGAATVGAGDARAAWAAQQVGYVLGDAGRSYVVGFGCSPPQRPHHRAASCPSPPAACGWAALDAPGPNPQVLFGAMVGGPSADDTYEDSRRDYQRNEVALDYNAAFSAAVGVLARRARLAGLSAPPPPSCGPAAPLAVVPPPPPRAATPPPPPPPRAATPPPPPVAASPAGSGGTVVRQAGTSAWWVDVALTPSTWQQAAVLHPSLGAVPMAADWGGGVARGRAATTLSVGVSGAVQVRVVWADGTATTTCVATSACSGGCVPGNC